MDRSFNHNWNLPEFMIAGTLFTYDSALDEFREKDVPANRIPMEGIWGDGIWSQFFFDSKTKNIYQGGFPDGNCPRHVQLILMPSLPYCAKLGIHVRDHHEREKAVKMEQDDKQLNLKLNHAKHKKGRKI